MLGEQIWSFSVPFFRFTQILLNVPHSELTITAISSLISTQRQGHTYSSTVFMKKMIPINNGWLHKLTKEIKDLNPYMHSQSHTRQDCTMDSSGKKGIFSRTFLSLVNSVHVQLNNSSASLHHRPQRTQMTIYRISL